MSVQAECPSCKHVFVRPDSLAGKLEKCPCCRSVLRLPLRSQPSPGDVGLEAPDGDREATKSGTVGSDPGTPCPSITPTFEGDVSPRSADADHDTQRPDQPARASGHATSLRTASRSENIQDNNLLFPQARPRRPRQIGLRRFNLVDARRTVMMFILMGVFYAASYYLLPWIQALILPRAPGGAMGPWVVRPAWVLRVFAAVILSVAPLPLLIMRFRRRWDAEDAAAGTQYDPFAGRPGWKVRIFVRSGLLALIYGIGLPFYLFSWTVVGPAGIDQRLPWGHRNRSFDKIKSLELTPWHKVVFVDGPSFTFGENNEGCSQADVSAMESLIAERSGQKWRVLPDAKPR